MAKILGSENHTSEALAIIKPLIQEGVYSVEMCAYLSIIREDENYKDVYFDALKKLRKMVLYLLKNSWKMNTIWL